MLVAVLVAVLVGTSVGGIMRGRVFDSFMLYGDMGTTTCDK